MGTARSRARQAGVSDRAAVGPGLLPKRTGGTGEGEHGVNFFSPVNKKEAHCLSAPANGLGDTGVPGGRRAEVRGWHPGLPCRETEPPRPPSP